MKRFLRSEAFLLAMLVLLSAFLFFFQLGKASLFETDEYIYTQISKEILQSGDWITLHLQGQPWFIHPPLHMWLTAITGSVFGFSEFFARLWCALFGIFGVVLTYFFGKKFFDAKTGLLSGLVLATSLQYILQARMAIFDIPLMFFTLLGTYIFWIGYKENKSWLYLLASIAWGLGTLMKGPIALGLPAIVILLFLAVKKDLWNFIQKNWLFAIPSAAIYFTLGFWWYAAEYLIHGAAFSNRVFGFYTFNRFFGVVETHTGPIWYYIPVLLLGFLPWVLFMGGAKLLFIKNRDKDEYLFAFLWMVVTFFFFSLAKTKLPGYIISIYPFMSIMVARYVAEKFEYSRWTRGFFYFCLIFVVGFYASLIYAITPLVESYKPMKPLAQIINQKALPTDKVIGYKVLYKMGFQYYTKNQIIFVEKLSVPWCRHAINRVPATDEKVFVILPENELAGLEKTIKNRKVQIQGKWADMVVVLIFATR